MAFWDSRMDPCGKYLRDQLYLYPVCASPDPLAHKDTYLYTSIPSTPPSESPTHKIGIMDAQQLLPSVPGDVKFRVLIIGRANAGKTSILQRVCDTTESPKIYRLGPRGKRERVRSHS
jgi:hypothetical protein